MNYVIDRIKIVLNTIVNKLIIIKLTIRDILIKISNSFFELNLVIDIINVVTINNNAAIIKFCFVLISKKSPLTSITNKLINMIDIIRKVTVTKLYLVCCFK